MKGSAVSARASSRNSTIRARVYRAAEDKWYDLGVIAQSPAITPSRWLRFKVWLKGVFGRGAAKPE